MAYTEAHILFTVQGDAWLQQETWQFGVRCRATPVAGVLDLDSLVNAMAAPTQTLWTNATMGFTNAARLLSLKAAYILETGKYPADVAASVYTYPAPVLGSNAGTFPLPQQTLAVSFSGNTPRGRASKGRIYLPPQNFAITNDGRISVAAADAFEAPIVTWLTALKGTAQVGEILIMSKLDAGKTTVINKVSIGRVVDTMRSRRRSLLEARTPVPLA
jgi:hypothetical protein